MSSLALQLTELGSSLLLGVLIAFLLQTYQLALGKSKFGRWYIYLCDIGFWLLAVVIVFTGLLITNGGEVRVHILLFLLLGGVWYRFYLRRRFHKTANWLAYPLAWIMKGLYWLLTLPVRLIRNWRRGGGDGNDNPDADAGSEVDDKAGEIKN